MSAPQDDRRVAVIIEDDADIRHLLEAVLTQAGFEAITASNGLDGVNAVRAHNPLVTTLDVSMPGMDGFETAKRIRAFSSTYLVMLTARDDEIDTLQGLEAGADDYLTKPFRPRELRARIEAMLRRPRHTATDAPAPAPGAAAAPSAPAAATPVTVPSASSAPIAPIVGPFNRRASAGAGR
ncbi:response regulator transcription factor, partial [Cryobacterium frigoriphilum]